VVVLAIFSGALLSAAFAPINFWPSAIFALAILIFVIEKSKRPYLHAFLFAFVFNALLLHWTSTYVGSVPWLLLSVLQGIFYAPLALIKKWGIGFFPLIYLVLEELRNHFPFGGFGWARLAYSQSDSPLAPLAAVGGVSLLGAMISLLALAIYLALKKKFAVILICILPVFLIFLPNNAIASGKVSALLVQGNVPKMGLDYNSRAKAVFDMHVAETQRALAGSDESIDFILWPENSVDIDPFTNPEVSNTLDALSEKTGAPIILGAVVGKTPNLFNQSILWTKSQRQIYSKQHLTPFGEYIPLRPLARLVSPFVDSVQDFRKGESNKVFKINGATIAPIICYELIDDQIVAGMAKTSNLVVVQTNNATFGLSAQSDQQLSITRIRAIEHQRNILSVSTTGKSALISYKGKIIKSTEMRSSAHLFIQTELISSKSRFDALGRWAQFGVFGYLFLIAATLRRRYK